MEAVIYLSSVGKIVPDERLNERIGKLKEGHFGFFVGTSDVLKGVDGYGDLNMTDSRVIEKYTNALRRKAK